MRSCRHPRALPREGELGPAAACFRVASHSPGPEAGAAARELPLLARAISAPAGVQGLGPRLRAPATLPSPGEGVGGRAAQGGAGGKREQRRGGRAWAGRGAGRKATALTVPSRRDAEDAVYGRDGYDYDGYRLRVEFPRSGRGTGRGGGGGGGGGAPRGRYGPPSRRSEYRVIVSGESFLFLSPSVCPPPGSCTQTSHPRVVQRRALCKKHRLAFPGRNAVGRLPAAPAGSPFAL